MNIRTLLVFLALTFGSNIDITGQVTTINGQVFYSINCDEKGNKGLSGVEISCEGINTISRADGTFTLEIPNKSAGTDLTVSFKKNGYHVDDIKETTVKSDQEFIHKFYMCKDGNNPTIIDLLKRSEERSIIITKEMASLKEEIKKKPKESQEYKDLEHQMNSLQKEKDGIIKRNLDLQKMNTILTSKNKNLEWNQLVKSLKNKDFHNIVKNNASEENLFLSEETIQLLEELLCEEDKGDIYCVVIKFYLYLYSQDYEKAEQLILATLNEEPDNLEIITCYAQLLQYQNKIEHTIKQLEKILTLSGDDKIQLLKTERTLGHLYLVINQPAKAKQYLTKAKKHLDTVKEDTSIYLIYLKADIYESFGYYYLQLNEFEKAEQNFLTARSIYIKELQEEERLSPNLAKMDKILGDIYFTQNQFQDSQNSYQKCLEVYKVLLNGTDFNDVLSYADALFSLANLCFKRNLLNDASEIYNQIEEVYENYEMQDPKMMPPYFADIYIAQGNVFLKKGKYYEAKIKFQDALAIYEVLVKDSQSFYLIKIAQIKGEIGKIYLYEENHELAITEFSTSINIIKPYVKRNSEQYQSDLGDAYLNVGKYFQAIEKYDSSFFYLKSAVDIFESYVKKNERVFLPMLIKGYQILALYYFDSGQQEKAQKEINQTIDLAEKLIQIDSTVFFPTYAITLMELGVLYEDKNEHQNAIKILEEAYNIFNNLSQKQESAYEREKASLLYFLGDIFILLDEKESQAKVKLDAALKICESQLKESEELYTPLIGDIFFAYAKLYLKNDRNLNALDYLDKAERKYEKSLSLNDLPSLKVKMINLKKRRAETYFDNDKHDFALIEISKIEQIINGIELKKVEKNLQITKIQLKKLAGKIYVEKEDFNKAIKSFDEGINLAKKLEREESSDKEVAIYHLEFYRLLIEKASLEFKRDNTSIGQEILQSIIDDISNPSTDDFKEVLAHTYFISGMNSSQTNQAKYFYNQSKNTYLSFEYQNEYTMGNIVNCIFNVGIEYYNQDNQMEAIDKFEEVILEVEKSEISKCRSTYIKSNEILGEIYLDKKNYDKSSTYFEVALKCNDNERLPLEIARLKMNAGIANIRINEGKGEALLQEAAKICRKHIEYPDALNMHKEICEYIDCD